MLIEVEVDNYNLRMPEKQYFSDNFQMIFYFSLYRILKCGTNLIKNLTLKFWQLHQLNVKTNKKENKKSLMTFIYNKDT